jgi:hypothetical protein
MAIQTTQLQMFAVQNKSLGRKSSVAKSDARFVSIYQTIAFKQRYPYAIELRIPDVPKLNGTEIRET